MPSFLENTEFCDNVNEPKLWKIVPGFLRKKSRNVKQNPPGIQEGAEENKNKAACVPPATVISENDAESFIAGEFALESRQTEEADNQPPASLGATRNLGSRLSWTFGYKTADAQHNLQRKKGVGLVNPTSQVSLVGPTCQAGQVVPTCQVGQDTNLEISVMRLDEEDGPSSIRPLQRGESFPAKLGAGTLSKHEAKRRLMSWRRTTIVRKNSEHQAN